MLNIKRRALRTLGVVSVVGLLALPAAASAELVSRQPGRGDGNHPPCQNVVEVQIPRRGTSVFLCYD